MPVDVQAALGRNLKRFCKTVLKGYAAEAEQTAKANAAWTDRTGDARRLIKGVVLDTGDTIGIALVHRVEYGKWLERDGNGKYAVLYPTIEAMKPRVFDAFKKYFGGR